MNDLQSIDWAALSLEAPPNSILKIGAAGLMKVFCNETRARECHFYLSWQNEHLITKRKPESLMKSSRVVVQCSGQHRFGIAEISFALFKSDEYLEALRNDLIVISRCGSRHCVAPHHLTAEKVEEASARGKCHRNRLGECTHELPCLRDNLVIAPESPPRRARPTVRPPAVIDESPTEPQSLITEVIKNTNCCLKKMITLKKSLENK